jgi:hypothetical protein
MTKGTRLAAAAVTAVLMASMFAWSETAVTGQGGPRGPRPPGGPLAPDLPVAKAYNDAARALASAVIRTNCIRLRFDGSSPR